MTRLASPTDVSAVRELLNYGLLETGLDVLVAMANPDSSGGAKTVFAHEVDDYEATKFLSGLATNTILFILSPFVK